MLFRHLEHIEFVNIAPTFIPLLMFSRENAVWFFVAAFENVTLSSLLQVFTETENNIACFCWPHLK